MPKGPQGQKRPAEIIDSAVMVACLGIEEITKDLKDLSGQVLSGIVGGHAGSESMTKEERSATAKQAAAARWG